MELCCSVAVPCAACAEPWGRSCSGAEGAGLQRWRGCEGGRVSAGRGVVFGSSCPHRGRRGAKLLPLHEAQPCFAPSTACPAPGRVSQREGRVPQLCGTAALVRTDTRPKQRQNLDKERPATQLKCTDREEPGGAHKVPKFKHQKDQKKKQKQKNKNTNQILRGGGHPTLLACSLVANSAASSPPPRRRGAGVGTDVECRLGPAPRRGRERGAGPGGGRDASH